MSHLLVQEFFARETVIVAQNLIGKTLISEIGGNRTSGRIVETEAYLPARDSACHASKYRTVRTEVMFGDAGFAYVYPIHAKFCFNIVTEITGLGCAVLIRSLEPLEGISTMQMRRGLNDNRRLTTGPGCLCQSLGIDRAINQLDLTDSEQLWLEAGFGSDRRGDTIKKSKRIGVTSAKSRLLRFFDSQSHFVSGPANLKQTGFARNSPKKHFPSN